MEGCFTSKTVAGGATLSFKLLKKSEVEALRTATTYRLWSLWGHDGKATDAGAMNTITFEIPEEEVVPDEEEEDLPEEEEEVVPEEE